MGNFIDKKYSKGAKKRIVFFARNSNIHGFRYIVQENSHLFARLFWTAVLIASGFCLYLILAPLVQRPADVNFMPDTLYLDWSTDFPAVTVCETNMFYKDVQKRMMELFPEMMEPLDQGLRRYFADIVFGRGSCKFDVCVPCGDKVPCDLPWRSIIDTVRLSCEKLISNCKFNDKDFHCCKYFQLADFENGACFAFNSYSNWNGSIEPFRMNRTTGPGLLTFKISAMATISVHSNVELATYDLPRENQFYVSTGSEVVYLFSTAETASDPVFQAESVEIRQCRYPHELLSGAPLHTYKTYSYGACELAKLTEETYKVCNCIHPMRDLSYQDKYCNFSGINCLVNYALQKKIAGEVSKPSGECLPSCSESELSAIHLISYTKSPVETMSNVTIKAINLPTVRYSRTILRSNLDLVVSLGGMFGLFFGASILSLVETIYLLIRINK